MAQKHEETVVFVLCTRSYEATERTDARMNQTDVKGLAEKFDAALAILDEIRASSGFDVLGAKRLEPHPRRETALEAAERAYADRRSRSDEFEDQRIFGEPAWDILLDLFIHQTRHEEVTVKSACVDSRAPETTTMRWLLALDGEGLIRIDHDPKDETRKMVSLTAEGYESMLRYLEKIAR
jgi:MoxR-like ATPase